VRFRPPTAAPAGRASYALWLRAQGWRRPETTTGASKGARPGQFFASPPWINGQPGGHRRAAHEPTPRGGGRYARAIRFNRRLPKHNDFKSSDNFSLTIGTAVTLRPGKPSMGVGVISLMVSRVAAGYRSSQLFKCPRSGSFSLGGDV
jgi:hypothetical protein